MSPTRQALLVRELYLLPRFHLSVRETLERRPPEVVEYSQPPPKSIELIQAAIRLVMDSCLKELSRSKQARTTSCDCRAAPAPPRLLTHGGFPSRLTRAI